MNVTNTEKKPFYRKKRFFVAMTALLLALSLLVGGLVLVFRSAPTVYTFGGAKMREDAYSYWFACRKYLAQVRYRELGIADTEAGWAALNEDGISYEDFFREMIDEEIRLRFVAAALFDSEGYTLPKADRKELDDLVDEFSTESFGTIPFEALEKVYRVDKNAVKQVALYEQKYTALYGKMFSDPAVIYSASYRNALKTFYETYYYRYNIIYVKDEAGADVIESLESALWPMGDAGVSSVTGVTEERFTQLEAEYTDENSKVTSGNYPNGVYLYAGESYARSFTAELLSAFAEANEVGKVVKKRNADNNGSYYVMRYALDSEPYLSENKLVSGCFEQLPNYAGAYLYRTLLRAELAKIVASGAEKNYTVTRTISCKEHNIVQLLGND